MSGKLIIFDLDGTIYKTETTLTKAIISASSDMNLQLTDVDRIQSLIGETSADFCRLMFPEISETEINRFREKLRFYERRLIPQDGELYNGIKDVLEELHTSGYSLAICSNSSLEYIKLVLSSCDIGRYIDIIRGYDSKKSKSELIREIINETKPTCVLLVGDQIHDLKAAEDNKIPFIRVAYGYGHHKMDCVNYVADNPKQILDFVCQNDLFCEIEHEINKIRPNRACIIGINGVDTSGKTIFTESFSMYLKSKGFKTALVHLDDFHNPKKLRYAESDEIKSYINNAFNLELIKYELLEPLAKNKDVDKTLKLLDLESDTFSKNIHFNIDNETIVLVEGTLLFRESIDEYFDYRLFLDINFDEVLHRAQQRDDVKYGRDIIKKYQKKYIPIQKWYLDKYKPRRRSDMIIDNQNYLHPTIVKS